MNLNKCAFLDIWTVLMQLNLKMQYVGTFFVVSLCQRLLQKFQDNNNNNNAKK